MKNTKITLTDIEKEKLLACVELVAKDFEAKRYEVEKELNKIEKERRRFYNELNRKVSIAIKNNQL